MLINIFIFGVVTAFQNLDENMSIGFGFGRFTVLSLTTLQGRRQRARRRSAYAVQYHAAGFRRPGAHRLPRQERIRRLRPQPSAGTGAPRWYFKIRRPFRYR